MATVNKCFARGQLPASSGILFSTINSAVVSIWLFNLNAADQTLVLSVNRPRGGLIELLNLTLPQFYKAQLSDIILEIGDAIYGSTTNATSVNYEITGAANTP